MGDKKVKFENKLLILAIVITRNQFVSNPHLGPLTH